MKENSNNNKKQYFLSEKEIFGIKLAYRDFEYYFTACAVCIYTCARSLGSYTRK